jgi:hypothetical protein
MRRPLTDCGRNPSRLRPQFLSKPCGSITIWIGGMAIRALDFMAKVSSRFAHEILPVATASVIGAMLVNHYGRQPASSAIVVQAQPSASEDAMVQSLRDEHDLIASIVKGREELAKRRQEQDMVAQRLESGAMQAASFAPAPDPVSDPPLPERRPAALPQSVGRSAPKAAARKKPAPMEAPLPQPDPPAIASGTPPLLDPLPPPAEIEPEQSKRPILRVAGAMREWVTDIAQAPVRAAFLPHLPDWPTLPPVDWTLGLFRRD